MESWIQLPPFPNDTQQTTCPHVASIPHFFPAVILEDTIEQDTRYQSISLLISSLHDLPRVQLLNQSRRQISSFGSGFPKRSEFFSPSKIRHFWRFLRRHNFGDNGFPLFGHLNFPVVCNFAVTSALCAHEVRELLFPSCDTVCHTCYLWSKQKRRTAVRLTFIREMAS